MGRQGQQKARWRAPGTILLAATCLALSHLVGCATSSSSPDLQRRAKFIRTQTEDQVTLQWESQSGHAYTVLYTTDMSQPGGWRTVPGYEIYQAHGPMTLIKFRAPVQGVRIYYRIEDVTTRR